MSTVVCPFCNADLPPQEIIEGWCETCGKKLPPFVRRSVAEAATDPRDESPAEHPGRTDGSETVRRASRRAYISWGVLAGYFGLGCVVGRYVGKRVAEQIGRTVQPPGDLLGLEDFARVGSVLLGGCAGVVIGLLQQMFEPRAVTVGCFCVAERPGSVVLGTLTEPEIRTRLNLGTLLPTFVCLPVEATGDLLAQWRPLWDVFGLPRPGAGAPVPSDGAKS